ncbi:MAG: hypothetical protein ABI402_08425 [Ferruginibacter sp.]
MNNSIVLSTVSLSTGTISEQQNNMHAVGTTSKSSPIRNIILLIVYLGLLFYSVTLFV